MFLGAPAVPVMLREMSRGLALVLDLESQAEVSSWCYFPLPDFEYTGELNDDAEKAL